MTLEQTAPGSKVSGRAWALPPRAWRPKTCWALLRTFQGQNPDLMSTIMSIGINYGGEELEAIRNQAHAHVLPRQQHGRGHAPGVLAGIEKELMAICASLLCGGSPGRRDDHLVRRHREHLQRRPRREDQGPASTRRRLPAEVGRRLVCAPGDLQGLSLPGHRVRARARQGLPGRRRRDGCGDRRPDHRPVRLGAQLAVRPLRRRPRHRAAGSGTTISGCTSTPASAGSSRRSPSGSGTRCRRGTSGCPACVRSRPTSTSGPTG